ncbi:hypothetical protein Tco_1010164, partial [Tanacetum coccineum]
RVERASTTAASLDVERAVVTSLRPNPRSERVLTPSYDSPLLGGNTPGSDEERIQQDDLTDFVPPTPYDSPLSGGHTPGSDEGRPNINEMMSICTNLSNRVLALETSKPAQDLVIRKLKKKLRKLEKKLSARTSGMKLFKISTSKRKSLDKEYVSKQGRKSDKIKPMFDDSDFVELDVDNAMENVKGDAETQGRNTAKQITTNGDIVNTASIDVSVVGPSNVSTADPFTSIVGDIFKDEMMTIADTLMAIRSTRPRTTLVVIRDVEEEPRRATPVPTVQSQERMDADELLAEKLQQEDREQFTIEEKSKMLVEMIAERKRFFATQRAEQIRNKPPTRAQLRNKMVTYLKHVGKKRAGEKLDDESVKRQKIEDDAEKEELRAYLDITLGDDEAVNVESLATKYPIVDWKTHVLSKNQMYYKIIRGDGSTKFYKIFTEMLDDFDRQDVLDLYRLALLFTCDREGDIILLPQDIALKNAE